MEFLTEKVFERRNKAYGAYELHRMYGQNVRKAVIIVGIALLTLCMVPVIGRLLPTDESVAVVKPDVEAVLEEIPMDEAEKNELPELIAAPPPPPPAFEQMQYIEPDIKRDEEIRTPEPSTVQVMDSLQNTSAMMGASNQTGESNETGIVLPQQGFGNGQSRGADEVVAPAATTEKEPDEKEFILVQQEPQPVNLDDIKRNLKYPEVAKQASIEGKVLMRILVNKEGTPVKHVVKKSPHELLTKACVDEIYKLRFKPAISSGKPVVCWIAIPFEFKLRK
jgi:periplasmic protein TonB